MKKFSFNFGKAAALVLGVTAFLFAGCDQSLAGGSGGPALTGTVAINGTARVGENLTAIPGGLDAAADLLEKQYRWQSKAAEGAEWTPIAEADTTTGTYRLVAGDEGKLITVLVSVAGYSGTIEPPEEGIKGPVLPPHPKTYAVNIGTTENGTVNTDKTTAEVGSKVTLTVSPAAGYKYAAASISVKNQGGTDESVSVVTGEPTKFTFVMPEGPVTVTARFEEVPSNEYSISVGSNITGGLVSHNQESSVTAGVEVTLTVTPNEGYKYKDGTLKVTYTPTGGSETEATLDADKKFTMPAFNVTVTAEFEKKSYTLTIGGGITNGTVTASADDNNVQSGGTVLYDTEVTLTLAPAEGYSVGTVTVTKSEDTASVEGDGNSRTFTMPASDVTVTATFTAIQYDITIDSNIQNGTVTASVNNSTAATATVGQTVTLTVTPDSGKKLKSLSVNGSPVSVSGNTYTFAMPASAVTVTAVFEAEQQNPGGGGGTPNLAAVRYQDTENKSSGAGIFDMDAWTYNGESRAESSEEAWTLKTVEKPYVYFTVTKAANQTVTASGADADDVTITVDGSAVDGTTTGAELAAVTVDTSDFDTMFDGKKRDFALAVSENGQQIKTINVTLNSGIDDTYGVTIFEVTREDGNMTITKESTGVGPEKGDGKETSMEVFKTNLQPVNDLYDANRWLEVWAESNKEYLIRINKDQRIKPVIIVMKGRDYVTVHLKGAGSRPPVITRDTNVTTNVSQNSSRVGHPLNTKDNTQIGFIALSPNLNSSGVNNGHMTFTMENVTIDMEDEPASSSTTYIAIKCLLGINKGVDVVMKKGATLTGVNKQASGEDMAVVKIKLGNVNFTMEAGSAITGNFEYAGSNSYKGLFRIDSTSKNKGDITFKRYGDTIYGNKKGEADNNIIHYNEKSIGCPEEWSALGN
jgi:hypothetical protein